MLKGKIDAHKKGLYYLREQIQNVVWEFMDVRLEGMAESAIPLVVSLWEIWSCNAGRLPQEMTQVDIVKGRVTEITVYE